MESITSRRNPLCVHVKKLGASRSYRDEHNEFLCDGLKLLEETVKSNAEIIIVLTSSQIPFRLPEGVRLYNLSNSLLDSISPLKNPQDVLFSCKKIIQTPIAYDIGTFMLLDNVQDPGNVGTIIRSADAFGISGILLTEGCADPYNPKTIRASMGAIFRQNVHMVNLNDIKQSGARIIGTTTDVNAIEISKANLDDAIIVLGNEGQGISNELRDICDEMITIPLRGNSQSLNVAVAASIIMWEAQKP